MQPSGFLVMALIGALPPNLPPVVTVGRTAQAPVVDGAMGDSCWQSAAVAAPFVLLGTADLPTQQTVVRLCYDAESLYAGFWCWEDNMAALHLAAKERDATNAWADDCVEVFLAPDGRGDVYYHVIVTAAGVIADEVCRTGGQREMAWDFAGQAAVGRSSRGWTCEIALPFSAMGDPSLSSPWLASFARGEHPHSEWSAWPALVGGFHETDRFGRILWRDSPAVIGLSVKPLWVGLNAVQLTAPPGGQALHAEAVVVRDGGQYRKSLQAQGDRLSFWLNDEGEGFFRLVIRAAPPAGQEVVKAPDAFATPPIHFYIPPITPFLDEAAGRLATATAVLQPLKRDVRVLKSDLRRAYADHAEISQDVALAKARAEASDEAWAALRERAAKLSQDAFLLLARAWTAARVPADPQPSFALGWQNSLIKLRRDDTRVNLSGPITLSACRGEGESAQIVVIALDKPVPIEKVTVSPLRRDGTGEELPASAVRLFRVDYVHTRPPAYPVDYVGWWPDPLVPPEPVEVAPGELQPYWVTIYVPADARPGLYRSRVWVRDAEGGVLSWPVQLHVWDLVLPWPSRLKTAFSMLPAYDQCLWYGFEGLPPRDYRLRLYELLFEHRLNPMSLYWDQIWPPREDLEWCVKRGLNAVNIRYVSNADPGVMDYVKEQADWLREKGFLPLAYVYGFDEAGPSLWPALRETYAKVRELVPDLPRACTVAPNEQLDGYIDIWVPLTASYDHREAEKRRRAGQEVWWYICCGPWHPYCNWFIDYPATDARVIFWQTFKYGVTGFLYYEIAMWRTNLITEPSADLTQIPHEDEAVRKAIAEGKRWPDVPWNTFTFARFNGDGLLIYPGRNQTPLPSLRLEVIRDGIEDYDLLSLLRDLRRQIFSGPVRYRLADGPVSKAGELLAVRPAVVKDLTHYTSDPVAILREREAVAKAALTLKSALQR
ncbi:MAG: DUF4091 domain-containing protein [Armatimonadetes bacterium]|nr:DUF4091 domain-containing protein [Armatimonadota bacterium]